MAGLRVYTVHVPTGAGQGVDQAIFVREGFSWGAFFFSVLWAVWHRMWFAAAMMAALILALGVASDAQVLHPRAEGLIAFAVALYFGFEGNEWYRSALRRRGYREAGVVVAPSLADAEQRWFTRHFASVLALA